MKKLIFLAVAAVVAVATAQNPLTPKPAPKPAAGEAVPKPVIPPEPVAKAEAPEDSIRRFFNYLQRTEVQQAYSTLTRGTKIAQNPGDVKMLQEKTAIALRDFGAIGGYEIVSTKKVGEHLTCYTALSLGKEFPLRWRFYFYKSADVWRLIDMRVDDRLAAMFDELEPARAHAEEP